MLQSRRKLFVPVDPEETEREREWRRRTHQVKEGDKITIKTEDTLLGYPQTAEVEVVMVGRYFVTVRFPAGYENSILWFDFERVRVQ